ncbi:hypothetical protein EMPS_02697 [Entomortierella parvispora]|uniref:Uncharacterized protein n=1 Tax=Entomortierella parvispora TaxID=205924 RepID=A0A9P3H5Y1_9FUNG|nr:hypothetical protein EMPS_02697 [Entomortierella parvispora]
MEEQPPVVKVLAVPELVDLVQVYLTSNTDLVHLTLVSKAFALLFNPLLWQTIEIRTERQHRLFVNTPQVQDAIRRLGNDCVRVIRVRTPKSLAPLVQANTPLLQLHTLEFPWPRRLIFEDMVFRARNLQPFEEELDVLNEPYPDHFFLEREKFHRTRAEPALSMTPEATDHRPLAATRPLRSLFWLQQRRKGIWRLEFDILHLALRMIRSEVPLRQAVEDMFHLRQSQEALAESNRLLRPLFAQAASGDLAGAKSKLEADQDIEDVFFRQATVLPELVSKLRRGVKLWEKLVPEEESLLLLIEDQINRINSFLAEDDRELSKSVTSVWERAKLRCQKHVGDVESLQRKLHTQEHQPYRASATIRRLQERVERNRQLLQQDVQQQRHDIYQQYMTLLLSRERTLKYWDSDLQMMLISFHHSHQRQGQLFITPIQRSLRNHLQSEPILLFQESSENRSPSLTLSGQLLDRMQTSVAEQLIYLSNFKPEENVRPAPPLVVPDPFNEPPLLSEWPSYSDLWDYFDPVSDVDEWLVPFLTQVCPNLRSFGCIYFPFASGSLLRALSSPPLSLSLTVLSLVNANPELHVDASELLQQLIDLPPRLDSFRFGAELVFNSEASSTQGLETLFSRFSIQGLPALGLTTLMIEGSIRDYDSRIWTGILRRCSNLETLGLRSYFPGTLLRELAELFINEGACPLLRELCLSGGTLDQDAELAKFLEACSMSADNSKTGDHSDGSGRYGPIILKSRRKGVTRIQLMDAGHLGQESYRVLHRCYHKTLTHLSIHDCPGPLSYKYRPTSPLLSDSFNGGDTAVHPILETLALFTGLQTLETFPSRSFYPYPTTEVNPGTFLDAHHLIHQYDRISEETANSTVAATLMPVAFQPWQCFSTLRVLQIIIGGNLLEIPEKGGTASGNGGRETRGVPVQRLAVLQNCRKICRMLGTLTALEELYLGSDSTGEVSALYQAAHDEVYEGKPPQSPSNEQPWTSLPRRTPTGSTEASTLPGLRAIPHLVRETAIYYGLQMDKSLKQDAQSNCLLMSLESGLDEMAELQALRVLDISFMDHEIGLPELQWMMEHWTSLKSVPGLMRDDWTDELDDWLRINAPHVRYY